MFEDVGWVPLLVLIAAILSAVLVANLDDED